MSEFFDEDVTLTTPEQRYAADRNLHVEFYKRPIRQGFLSEQEHREIYQDVEYVTIRIPGDKLSVIDTPVTETERRRFPELYKRFLDTSDYSFIGTPLKEWPTIKPSRLLELAAMHIRTVEDIANCSDANGAKIMGFNALKKKATLYLAAAKEAADEDRMVEKVAARVTEKAAEKATALSK
jgi:hypothetical protein